MPTPIHPFYHSFCHPICAAALLLASPIARAQEAPPPPPGEPPPKAISETAAEVQHLKREVQELKDRLDKGATTNDTQGIQADLENFKYQYQRDRETKSALSNRNLLITGLIYNVAANGLAGLQTSLLGALFGFGVLVFLYILGAMGAGDVTMLGAEIISALQAKAERAGEIR